MGNKRNIIISIVGIVVIIWSINFFFKKDTYIGFYYPDANNLTNDIQSKETFSTLEACRDWVDEQKSIYNPSATNSDDYECGKNCDLQNGQKPYICEETLE